MKEISQNEKAIILIAMFDFSYKKQADIFALFKQPENIFDVLKNNANALSGIFDDAQINELKNAAGERLDAYIKNLQLLNIEFITFLSKEYPDELKEIDCPPFVLFYRGDIRLLKGKNIAVVGTRMPTVYGKLITEQFAKGLTQNEFNIVSGLAGGVDTISHKTCLANGGKTIAVLGGGLNHIYPAFNANLCKEIIEKGGLVITEYSPNFKPTLYSFPFRNRLISAFSKGVLITEAGEKSGSLHTKEYALEQGKEVFVVPGNINSPTSKGTNRLIKSLQGACVTQVEDIIEKLGYQPVIISRQTYQQLGMDEQIVMNNLTGEPIEFESLQLKTKLDTKTLNSCLTMLLIRGLIKKLPGNLFCVA